jgi:hypothetical protein
MPGPPASLRNRFLAAIRYWEPRRLIYNLLLTLVAIEWMIATWPHFRPAMTFSSLLIIATLALLANACYCAAYLVDIPMQRSSLAAIWSQRRWLLWSFGILFAIVLENYWIGDEIYPFVR